MANKLRADLTIQQDSVETDLVVGDTKVLIASSLAFIKALGLELSLVLIQAEKSISAVRVGVAVELAIT